MESVTSLPVGCLVASRWLKDDLSKEIMCVFMCVCACLCACISIYLYMCVDVCVLHM